jgi:hypothetical protein
LGAFVFQAALSWIGVLVILWQAASVLLKTLRDAMQSTPEEIKLLRFPLRNNPNLSREAVWAYIHALQVKVGEAAPDELALLRSLHNMHEQHPYFDRRAALSQLSGLKVVSDAIISSALSRVSLTTEEVEEAEDD